MGTVVVSIPTVVSANPPTPTLCLASASTSNSHTEDSVDARTGANPLVLAYLAANQISTAALHPSKFNNKTYRVDLAVDLTNLTKDLTLVDLTLDLFSQVENCYNLL